MKISVSRRLRRDDEVDDLETALGVDLHGARLEGEQRVVATAPDVGAGVEVGAALADDDLAGLDDLAAEALVAEALRVRVATVTGGLCALLVRHVFSPCLLDAGDLDACE